MERGEWAVDSQIPTEEELCRLFDVSKATVRIAVAELVREGYLRRQQGKGTFVCKRVIPEGLSMLTSFKEIMLEAGVVFETRVLAQTVMMMTDDLELKLDVPENRHIIYLKRVRLVGEEPVLLQESYLPHAVCPALLAEELERQSILELLEQRCGVRVTRVRDYIEVVALGRGGGEAPRPGRRVPGAAAGAVLLRRRSAGNVHSIAQAAGAFPVRHRARAQVI